VNGNQRLFSALWHETDAAIRKRRDVTLAIDASAAELPGRIGVSGLLAQIAERRSVSFAGTLK
jgi:hypothetical protein